MCVNKVEFVKIRIIILGVLSLFLYLIGLFFVNGLKY